MQQFSMYWCANYTITSTDAQSGTPVAVNGNGGGGSDQVLLFCLEMVAKQLSAKTKKNGKQKLYFHTDQSYNT